RKLCQQKLRRAEKERELSLNVERELDLYYQKNKARLDYVGRCLFDREEDESSPSPSQSDASASALDKLFGELQLQPPKQCPKDTSGAVETPAERAATTSPAKGQGPSLQLVAPDAPSKWPH
ncbi:hypothetical protein BGW38_009104, partial [Lunasporangiospora selenospora]